MKWEEMGDQGRNGLVAEIMGWTNIRPMDKVVNRMIGQHPTLRSGVVPRYTLHSEQIAAVRQEIARRELRDEFIRALIVVVGIDIEHAATHTWYASEKDLFALVNATPEQQCLAALRACGVDI